MGRHVIQNWSPTRNRIFAPDIIDEINNKEGEPLVQYTVEVENDYMIAKIYWILNREISNIKLYKKDQLSHF